MIRRRAAGARAVPFPIVGAQSHGADLAGYEDLRAGRVKNVYRVRPSRGTPESGIA